MLHVIHMRLHQFNTAPGHTHYEIGQAIEFRVIFKDDNSGDMYLT